eukprot:scaffold125549_cov48-Phaeocystis_antarctica.AAC.1
MDMAAPGCVGSQPECMGPQPGYALGRSPGCAQGRGRGMGVPVRLSVDPCVDPGPGRPGSFSSGRSPRTRVPGWGW